MTRQATISQSITRRMERLFAGKVYKALQSQIKGFTANVRAVGMDYAVSKLQTTLLNEDIGPVIQQLYRIGAITNANNVYRTLKKAEPQLKFVGFGFNDVWTQDVNRYFQLHLLEKAVVPISETTKKQILAAIQKGTTEGWSVDQILKELETSDITRNRARMIVRTESVRATNFGGMLGAYESKYVMEKVWVSAHDVRVRGTRPEDEFSHRSLDKLQVDLLEAFHDTRNGEPIMFPGDPNASAGNTINCRCTLGFVPKKDKDGRLIRKPAPAVEGVRISIVDILGAAMFGINLFQQFELNDN